MTKAIITMNDLSTMTLELYSNIAPITVENFTKLAKSGFYDGLVFHRVIRNFMIQGGDPEGTGMGGPGHHIKGEFIANGVNNTIKHARGVISMARLNDYDSAGSQFFIMHKDSVHLDGQYAAFGKVIEGIETVDAIAQQKTDYSDRPVTEQKIKTIVIEE
ncbi:MAG: peptidylprolyl isomerase [Clostridia bacterium]|nr:peptidylprolyl isomerase [Clostridia bacterium]